MTFATEYRFEDLKLAGEGLMAHGIATLTASGEDYPGEFYVSKIVLDDSGLTIKDTELGNDKWRSLLFLHIATLIESDDHAQAFFAASEAEAEAGAKVVTFTRQYLTMNHRQQGMSR